VTEIEGKFRGTRGYLRRAAGEGDGGEGRGRTQEKGGAARE